MSKKKSLSGSTAWYTLGNLFIRSVSFLLLPLYSNYISKEDFGNYALLMSLYVIISVIYQFGLHSALSKYYLEEKNENKRKIIFSTAFNFVLILGLIVTAAALFLSREISQLVLGSGEYAKLICLIFLCLLFETSTYFILHLLKTKEFASRVVMYSSINAAINLILNVLFVYYLQMQVEGILLAQLISSLLLFISLLPVLKSNYILSIDRKLLFLLFRFAFPFIIGGMLAAAVDVADRFILNFFLGKEEVGVYSFSYKIAMIMNVFVISFRTAWTPYSMNLFHSGNYKEHFGQTLNKLTALSGLILLLITFFTDDLFSIKIFGSHLINNDYLPGIVILPFVLSGYIFSGIASLYSVYPYISGKSYHFLISDSTAFIINITLNFILIPQLGILGAAAATTLSFLAAAVYLISVSIKAVKIKYEFQNLLVILISALCLLTIGMIFTNIFLDLLFTAGYLVIILKVLRLRMREVLRIKK
jgi:O-antigen/teichoic acid export membrane protein